MGGTDAGRRGAKKSGADSLGNGGKSTPGGAARTVKGGGRAEAELLRGLRFLRLERRMPDVQKNHGCVEGSTSAECSTSFGQTVGIYMLLAEVRFWLITRTGRYLEKNVARGHELEFWASGIIARCTVDEYLENSILEIMIMSNTKLLGKIRFCIKLFVFLYGYKTLLQRSHQKNRAVQRFP
ncbi:hypothetical protein [uncultured Mailhella sp.]|uniref:hypothetical protein n=1 Tax=uncultured Mailhella sp. TaxID=1981031 RepID=UPI002623471F|nr:hypothetical protein [uncultured Mailhella sp.]